jgi:hypothetical protein
MEERLLLFSGHFILMGGAVITGGFPGSIFIGRDAETAGNPYVCPS